MSTPSDEWPDAVELARRIRDGEVATIDVLESTIAKIERTNTQLNAVITPLFDRARARLATIDSSAPFAGVPILVKDFICHTAGDPFFEGMAKLKSIGWTEDEDTETAARLQKAGFVVVGKTNTSELGMTPDTQPLAFGATRNPWNPELTPMGSSGGSAAAVAAGVVPVAYGNDGGGSIRLPAGACGLFGLKPSRGRVSLGPEFGDLIGGLAVEHVVTRSVRDSAGVLDCTSGRVAGEPYHAPYTADRFVDALVARPSGLRIGIWDTLAGERVSSDSQAAVQAAVRALSELGHHVEQSKPAVLGDAALRPSIGLHFAAMTAWVLDHYWPRRTGLTFDEGDVEPGTWLLAEAGRRASASDYMAAREDVQLFARAVASWWQAGFDLLLTPTMPNLPPKVGERAAISCIAFTAPFNATGQPAASIPIHWNQDGIPVGAQLVADYGREDLLFGVGAQLEEACPWASRKPKISVA